MAVVLSVGRDHVRERKVFEMAFASAHNACYLYVFIPAFL